MSQADINAPMLPASGRNVGAPRTQRSGSSSSSGSGRGVEMQQQQQQQVEGDLEAGGGASTACFICLEDGSTEPLANCCTQCYAVTHRSCWQQWASNLRLTTLRSRLLGQSRPDPILCTICKTGQGRIVGQEAAGEGSEETVEVLQEQLLHTLGELGRVANDEDEYDDDGQELCTPWSSALNIGIFITAGLVDLLLIILARLYPSDVVLMTLLILYCFVVLQIVGLSIYQRRLAFQSTMTWLRTWEGDSSTAFRTEQRHVPRFVDPNPASSALFSGQNDRERRGANEADEGSRSDLRAPFLSGTRGSPSAGNRSGRDPSGAEDDRDERLRGKRGQGLLPDAPGAVGLRPISSTAEQSSDQVRRPSGASGGNVEMTSMSISRQQRTGKPESNRRGRYSSVQEAAQAAGSPTVSRGGRRNLDRADSSDVLAETESDSVLRPLPAGSAGASDGGGDQAWTLDSSENQSDVMAYER
uniref:RING-CH-type domain-containing protein n=1 Tax=Chromera velia CCMP2878 TaxID=1169474 RepID=A0A0G4FKT5_9ALVE|eukprot:Cvel_17528.t1-p1 / transcript=Cvel_17528.t1 / gene=Cvel_17528 / organism=Chromera_velia_CCMP2878 / gene_product=hypothetical protein / transcript_product=hypothetical protein / location=Cvel_scaffold1405:21445-23963(-) / protein_length=471 / sequence_SO=supercontig / SO=protein_coding / is_pseudo=false